MGQKKVMAIDFNHSKPGFYYTTDEEFKDECIKQAQHLLNHRFDFVQENAQGQEITASMFPPMPMMINVLYEDGSFAQTLLHPENDDEKQYLLTGAKKMVMKYGKTKKAKAVFLIMEAWMGEISTKDMRAADPFAKEMTEEQIQRRVSREWKENKIKKVTRIVCEYQTPVTINNKPQTAVVTTVYKLLEHKLLVLDDAKTEKMNEMHDDVNQKRKPWFCFFTPQEDDEYTKNVLNFNVLTAAQFLQALNKLM